jgi:hypothetical protein
MTSLTGAKVTPISLKGVRVVWPRLVALRLDQFAVVEGRDLLISLLLEAAGPKVRAMKNLGYRPGRISLSATRKHLLVWNDAGNWCEVRDSKTLEVLTNQSAPDPFEATFGMLGGDDILFTARSGGIDLFALPKGQPIMHVDCDKPKRFICTQLVGLGDGEALGIVGHNYLDLPVSAVVSVPSSLIEEESEFVAGLRGASNAGDVQVVLGPCGWEEILVYKQPSRRSDQPAKPVGFAINKLQTQEGEPGIGPVVEFIPYEAPLAANAHIMATSLAIAVASDEGIRLLPRKALLQEASFVPARAFGFDPDAGRVVIVGPECEISVLDLPRI